MTAGEQGPEHALVGVGEGARPGGWPGVATAAFRTTLADPNLRRAQLAFGVIVAAQWAFTVALSVVAFRQGGTAAVGIVLMICMLPAALLGPFGAVLADRLARERVLIGVGSLQALATGCAALALGVGAGTIVVYGLAIVTAVTFTAVRPAHSALLPSLCKTPQQLTSATVVRGLMDSVGTLVGPVVAAAGLAVGGPAAVRRDRGRHGVVGAADHARSLRAAAARRGAASPHRARGGRGSRSACALQGCRADHGDRAGTDVHARVRERARGDRGD